MSVASVARVRQIVHQKSGPACESKAKVPAAAAAAAQQQQQEEQQQQQQEEQQQQQRISISSGSGSSRSTNSSSSSRSTNSSSSSSSDGAARQSSPTQRPGAATTKAPHVVAAPSPTSPQLRDASNIASTARACALAGKCPSDPVVAKLPRAGPGGLRYLTLTPLLHLPTSAAPSFTRDSTSHASSASSSPSKKTEGEKRPPAMADVRWKSVRPTFWVDHTVDHSSKATRPVHVIQDGARTRGRSEAGTEGRWR
jgi:hypothetical protein